MPSPRSLRMKFYTAVAPSPSTSNQSKVSLSSENLIKPSEIEPVEIIPNEENKTMSLPQKVCRLSLILFIILLITRSCYERE